MAQVADAVVGDLEEEANRLSVTTANLIDAVNSIAHAIYGKEGSDYETQAANFLPFPARIKESKEEIEGSITPSVETLKILFEEIDKGTIPAAVVAHLYPLLPDWKKLING